MNLQRFRHAGLPPPKRVSVLILLLHLAAFGVMAATERSIAGWLMFVAAWAILNGIGLFVFRRPAIAAALSLGLVALLVTLSRFKFDVMYMTVDFLDLLIVDVDTTTFLFAIFPFLKWAVAGGALAFAAAAIVLWRIDPFRVPRQRALLATVAGFLSLVGLTAIAPGNWWEVFADRNYVSKFARSGVQAVSELTTHGMFDSAAVASTSLVAEATACEPAGKPPNIILIHDESSFDIRVAPNVKVPEGYGSHFRSWDGKARRFVTESFGGASWYSEFNVLAGLSSQSFGRFAYFLPRVAAGRVERGLPRTLQRCGYQTFSFYPASAAFMSAKNFHASVGIEHFFDNRAMGANFVEPDGFYYQFAATKLKQSKAPFFAYIYLSGNHFPFSRDWHPDILPEWRDPGNRKEIDEYLRRQAISVRDLAAFKERLKRDFPTEPFLIVRYGDHQPAFPPPNVMEPDLTEDEVALKIRNRDPKYYVTYYAIDTINFEPTDASSALDTLDGAYLPLVIQELAGLPLDPSFAEQKRIMARCEGIFFGCAAGTEARRFNRLLIDAGLVKRL